MEPQYTNKTFVKAHLKDGSTVNRPLEAFGSKAYVEMTLKKEGYDVKRIEYVENRWWVRMGTRGYLNSEPWEGPFITRKKAEIHIKSKTR